MRFALALAASSVLALSSLAGCAADTAQEDESIAAQDAATRRAQTSCTHEAYRNALATYKDTVARAKQHLRGETCDEATTYAILEGAQAAVEQCGAFETVFATSIWAKPVRDALAKNLGLAEITGKMVPVENGRATWSGLAEALPGKTIYGPAPGAFGNVSKLELAADGRATLSTLDTDAYAWSSKSVTYEIGGVRDDGSIGFTVIDGATRTEYTLDHADMGTGLVLPIYELKPAAGGASSFSIPSECEA